jgi:TonB family protein
MVALILNWVTGQSMHTHSKRQTATTMALAVMSAISMCMAPAHASGLTVTTAPLAPDTAIHETQAGKVALIASLKSFKAHISRAAISTDDASRVSFQEYYVDWSHWMTDIANRWTLVFNAGYSSGNLNPTDTAEVQFTCTKDGTISNIVMLSSSGDPECDRNHILALQAISPLPQFPAGCKKKNLTFLYVWDYGTKTAARAKREHAKTASRHIRIDDSTKVSITGKIM